MNRKHSSPTFVTVRFVITLREFSCAKRCLARRSQIAMANPVPVRYVGEQHVKEDLGRIPTAQDWLMQIKPQRWMYGQRLDEELCNPD